MVSYFSSVTKSLLFASISYNVGQSKEWRLLRSTNWWQYLRFRREGAAACKPNWCWDAGCYWGPWQALGCWGQLAWIHRALRSQRQPKLNLASQPLSQSKCSQSAFRMPFDWLTGWLARFKAFFDWLTGWLARFRAFFDWLTGWLARFKGRETAGELLGNRQAQPGNNQKPTK